MTTTNQALDLSSIRGTDSNSLLRLYDQVQDIASKSLLQLERSRADKAVERIAKELQKRNIRY